MESLACENLLEGLSIRKLQLEGEIERQNVFLENAIEGSLRIKTSYGTFQYYHITNENKKGVYLGKEKLWLKKNLAQKEYSQKLLPVLKKEYCCIEKLIECLNKNKITDVYDSLKKGSKEFVTQVTLKNEDYISKWLQVSYEKKAFDINAPMLFTSKDQRVRSKSELIIAQVLDEMKIPYRYEYPVKLYRSKSSSVVLHPDFYCLNVRSRKEYMWEHFGMMDNFEYAEKAIKKLALYEKNGIVSGKNLIVTMETKNTPVSVHRIRKVVEEYFL